MLPGIKTKNNLIDWYSLHGISPVRYDDSDLEAHFRRRRSLYDSLGVPGILLSKSDVLEVGPGSGQNSLYVAKCKPPVYELIEPNVAALEQIREVYSGFEHPHTKPTLNEIRLEEFFSDRLFDICICENWLGWSDYDRSMVSKLSGLVAPGGILVITTCSPVGLIPNVARRVLGHMLVDARHNLQEKTKILENALSSHLSTIKHMTRSHEDWIMDTILNEAWLGNGLTVRLLYETLGDSFSFYGTSPRFLSDWRWYKSMVENVSSKNALFLDNFYAQIHNFIDYREVFPPRDPESNRALEDKAWAFVDAANTWELGEGSGSDADEIVAALSELCRDIEDFCPRTGAMLREPLSLIQQGRAEAEDVAGMPTFSGLFGRELVHTSLQREME